MNKIKTHTIALLATTTMMILLSLSACGQTHNTGAFRVASQSAVFGIPLPTGTMIYDDSSSRAYIIEDNASSNMSLLSYSQHGLNVLDLQLWEGHAFDNYLNQPVLSTSSPHFMNINMGGNINSTNIIPWDANLYDLGSSSNYFAHIYSNNIHIYGTSTLDGNANIGVDLTVAGLVTTSKFKMTTGATDGYYLRSDASGNAAWAPVNVSQVYKGTWSAASNTPALANGSGTAGWYYRCVEAGTVDFGNGNITFDIGDDVTYNGTLWERIPGQGYTLQTASSSVLGGVKIGSGVSIDANGSISVDTNYVTLSDAAGYLYPEYIGIYVPQIWTVTPLNTGDFRIYNHINESDTTAQAGTIHASADSMFVDITVPGHYEITYSFSFWSSVNDLITFRLLTSTTDIFDVKNITAAANYHYSITLTTTKYLTAGKQIYIQVAGANSTPTIHFQYMNIIVKKL